MLAHHANPNTGDLRSAQWRGREPRAKRKDPRAKRRLMVTVRRAESLFHRRTTKSSTSRMTTRIKATFALVVPKADHVPADIRRVAIRNLISVPPAEALKADKVIDVDTRRIKVMTNRPATHRARRAVPKVKPAATVLRHTDINPMRPPNPISQSRLTMISAAVVDGS